MYEGPNTFSSVKNVPLSNWRYLQQKHSVILGHNAMLRKLPTIPAASYDAQERPAAKRPVQCLINKVAID